MEEPIDPLSVFRGVVEELGDKIDAIGENVTSQQEKAGPSQHLDGVIIEFWEVSRSKDILSLVYETEHTLKVRRFRPGGRNVADFSLSNTTLAGFISDYYDQLRHRGIRHDEEEIMLGDAVSEGILHRQVYSDKSREMVEEIGGIIGYLKQKYEGKT